MSVLVPRSIQYRFNIDHGDGLSLITEDGKMEARREPGTPRLGMMSEVSESYGDVKRRTEDRESWRKR